MSTTNPIATVVVAGGGITAWSAAAALKRRIPSLDVQLVETPPAPEALADRIISTLPSICGFHADIGLAESDVIGGAVSGLRLGTRFEGWAVHQPDYVHAYGSCGAPVGAVPFHQLWAREDAAAGPLPAFDRFSRAAELAKRGGQSNLDSQPVGLQLTLARYAEMLRAYALHLGVAVRRSAIEQVEVRSDNGFIDALKLQNGGRISGELFVDCTGAASLLQRQLEVPFLDWSSWLPCDRVSMASGLADPTAITMDRNAAFAAGWRWTASSVQAASRGMVYSSACSEPTEVDGDANSFSIHQGRRRDFWVRNCVAIGDAAVTVEPLEWTNLHLVHSQIDRLVAMLPGRDCAPVEIAPFNSECAAEADRVRDFLCLHYICSHRSEPFWKNAASIKPPSSLEHTLALFRERGRLPYYQEETFTRDSWLTVLLGQGVRPRRIDPLADLVSAQEAAQAFAAMRQSMPS